MSTVPGPVIRFIVDQPGLSAAVEPAMKQVKQQAQTTSQAVVAEWKRMTAQLRAGIAEESLSLKGIQNLRYSILNQVDKEIALLRAKNALSNKELANLKAMTLERERQVNAIKTGAKVGITSGTEHALYQASTQTFLGITRTLDALVNRYFGGAAGSAFRTLRDTAYYSSMAGGTQGTGSSSGVLGKIFTPAGLATAVGVGGLIAGTAAITKMSLAGGKLAEELQNTANKTGLTVAEVVKLRAVSDVLGVDFDRVQTGFRKFDQEITLASQASLPNASQQAKKAGELFKLLGVNIQQAAKDPFSAIQQLSRALSILPDGAIKTAVAVQLFGRGGMELLPVLDRMPGALNATKKSTDDLVRALTDGAAKSMEDLRAQTESFKIEADALEVSLAKHVLPALTSIVGFFNKIGDFWSKHPSFLAPMAAVFSPSSSSSPSLNLGGFLDYTKTSGAGTASQNLNDYAKAIAETGRNAKKAKTQIEKVFEDVDKDWFRSSYPRPRFSGTGTRSASRQTYSSLGAAPGAGDLLFGLPSSPTFSLLNLGPGTPPGIQDQLSKVQDEYFEATASESDKIKKQYDEQLDYWKFIQQQYPDYAQQAADAITEIQAVENKKLADLQQKQFEEYKRQADSLFSDLISGKTKQFSKQFESDIEDIVFEPFKKQFESVIGGLLQNLNQSVNGGGASGAAVPSSTGILGRIFGPVFGPGGTPGTFSGSLGLNGPGSRQSTTQTMYVRAGIVNIGAGGTSSTGAPGGGGFSSLSLSLPGGNGWTSFNSSSSLYNNTPSFLGGGIGALLGAGSSSSTFSGVGGGSAVSLSGSGPNALSKVLASIVSLPSSAMAQIGSLIGGSNGSTIMQALGGLAVAGIGGIHGSVAGEATGAATTATSLAKLFGASNASSLFGASAAPAPGSLAAKLGIQGPANLAQQLAGLFGGGSMLASGISAGGVGGGLEDLAGGAELGTAIMPGLGTIIGAAIGGLTGIIRGIFGGDSWSQRVANAQRNQAIYLPPSENFSFASLPGASISQTMGTGFGMVGNTGTSYGLPSNTPFTANSIYGPLNNWQKQQLNQWYYGLNPNEPFFGAGATSNPPADPFTGNFGGWNGKPFPTSPSIQVHFNLPGYVSADSAEAALAPAIGRLTQMVSKQFSQSSSGIATMSRRVNNLP